MTDITGLLFVVLIIILWKVDKRRENKKKRLRFIGDTTFWQ